MQKSLEEEVWQRANGVCEYCHLPQAYHRVPFQVDHVIAEQHGGQTVSENLAVSCLRCNKRKGPNFAGVDFARCPACGLGRTRIVDRLQPERPCPGRATWDAS